MFEASTNILADQFKQTLRDSFSTDVLAQAEIAVQDGLIKNFFVESGRLSCRMVLSEPVALRLDIEPLPLDMWSGYCSWCAERPEVLTYLYNLIPDPLCFPPTFLDNLLNIPFADIVAHCENAEQESMITPQLAATMWTFLAKELETEPFLLALLRGRGADQIVHEVRTVRKSALLAREHIDTVREEGGKLKLSPEAFYGSRALCESRRLQVRADELPAVLLKRLDRLPLMLDLASVDDHLEGAYERIARLAQSLARFL